MDWKKGSQYGALAGLFGDSGSPYDAASEQYDIYGQKGEAAQNPFFEAGKGALGNYQSWLSNMKDPTEFINSTMNKYQESPWARYQQNEAMRAANNIGSAYGLSGSSALQQQAQQNAANISSQDQNQWLQNILGINTSYGQGQQNLVTGGQDAANSLTNLFSNLGTQKGAAAYGAENERNFDWQNYMKLALQLAAL